MTGQLTWYDILDILPGASADQVRRACDARASALGAAMISGATSKVVAAAGRATTAIEAAQRILLDPARRRQYDEQAGIRRPGGGLERSDPVAAEGVWGGWSRTSRRGRPPGPAGRAR
jgi:curved DNA-binding protein CbpA